MFGYCIAVLCLSYNIPNRKANLARKHLLVHLFLNILDKSGLVVLVADTQ